MDKEGSQLIRGLEGVVAAETQLCDLDAAGLAAQEHLEEARRLRLQLHFERAQP